MKVTLSAKLIAKYSEELACFDEQFIFFYRKISVLDIIMCRTCMHLENEIN